MNKLEKQEMKKFITAGHAIFTILNPNTGKRFTYKARCKFHKGQRVTPFFVSVLYGPDTYQNYHYIGFIRRGVFYHGGKKTRTRPDSVSVKAFRWFWTHLDGNLGPLEVYHVGKCGRCGRRLTVPESIKKGFGPDCAAA